MKALGIAIDNREMVMKELNKIIITPYPEYPKVLSIEITTNENNDISPVSMKITTKGITTVYELQSYFQLVESDKFYEEIGE